LGFGGGSGGVAGGVRGCYIYITQIDTFNTQTHLLLGELLEVHGELVGDAHVVDQHAHLQALERLLHLLHSRVVEVAVVDAWWCWLWWV
jgi:hypothetical protein